MLEFEPFFNESKDIQIKNVKELIEYLKTLPQDAKCTYDYGLGLEIEYNAESNTVDFH